jgi:hypothetical protein
MATSASSRDCSSGNTAAIASNSAGVRILNGLAGTGGAATPLHGCKRITWSFSAVVKIELSTVLHRCTVVADRRPSSVSRRMKSRTWEGRISTIRIAPNSGSRYRLITEV